MTHPLAPQGTAIVGNTQSYRPIYALEPLHRLQQPSLRRMLSSGLFGLGARYYVPELAGDCLAPSITDAFAIMDLRGDIREGDVFAFSVRDWQTVFGHYPPSIGAAVERFRGVNRDRAVLECVCTNPPACHSHGLNEPAVGVSHCSDRADALGSD